ncbi:MAG: pilus assembly protein N-terminal domain-containing protein [Clostridium sp.]|nr:pilus assembly protein N-terminal domain-containing protein [Clostridium sp.]
MKKKSISTMLAVLLLLTAILSPCRMDTASAAAKIRVSKAKVTVVKGDRITIKAKNTGMRKIKATVSDRKIASVRVIKKKIRITGKKPGKTNITLTAYPMKKCVVKVVVVPDEEGEVEVVIPTKAPTKRPSASPNVRVTTKPTIKPSARPSQLPTTEPGVTASAEPDRSAEPAETVVPTKKPGVSEQPEASVEPTPTELPTTDTPVSSPKATVTPGRTPKASATAKPAKTPAATPKASATAKPAKTPAATPKASATAKPAKTPAATPKASAAAKPTTTPAATPKASATPKPTTTPSATPKASATADPIITAKPTITPTVSATTTPTDVPAATLQTTRLCFAEKSLYIGESTEALQADWGEPERIDPLPQTNMTAYIYNGNSTTEPYLLVGIKDQKVASYFTIGKGFTVYDATVNTVDGTAAQQTELVQEGASAASMVDAGWSENTDNFYALNSAKQEAKEGTEAYYRLTDNAYMYAFSDFYDGKDKAVYGFYAFSKDCNKYKMIYRTYMTYNDEILRAAETQVWEMTNAYRTYMGLSNLQWESKAEAAARGHSQDMADNNYFQHNSQDGTRFFARLQAEGISYRSCGENICAGSGDAIYMVIGWIGSSGHRNGILTPSFKYIGVGVAYNASAKWLVYATQDFWG